MRCPSFWSNHVQWPTFWTWFGSENRVPHRPTLWQLGKTTINQWIRGPIFRSKAVTNSSHFAGDHPQSFALGIFGSLGVESFAPGDPFARGSCATAEVKPMRWVVWSNYFWVYHITFCWTPHVDQCFSQSSKNKRTAGCPAVRVRPANLWYPRFLTGLEFLIVTDSCKIQFCYPCAKKQQRSAVAWIRMASRYYLSPWWGSQ